MKPTDARVVGAQLYFLPVETRVPLKFGAEVLTSVTCARARVVIQSRRGRRAEGWGETPLSVQWLWPGSTPYAERHATLKDFCLDLCRTLPEFGARGHPLEVSHDFQTGPLRALLRSLKRRRAGREPVPWLAALGCFSPFDLALHDAFGKLVGRPVFSTLTRSFLSRDLAAFLQPARPGTNQFRGRFPIEFLLPEPRATLRAWHLVGGLDPLTHSDLTGKEPKDGWPVLLEDWIKSDGLACLKVKLRGTDSRWDYLRLVRVGAIAQARGVEWLSADFNCTVLDPAYVCEILDRLRDEHPRLYGMILYVEQPFPSELTAHPLDVRSVASRKPLFLDESAHDWRAVKLGQELGWSGVALKTCKTLSGALLSACWAQAHGMTLMVQDLTNPMLAQIPHLLLASHLPTIMGVETNAMQFYPEASRPEACVHPGIYRRRHGRVDLSTLRGAGFGYRIGKIHRELPAPAISCGECGS